MVVPKNDKLTVPCSCGCLMVTFDRFDDELWVEMYTHVGAHAGWLWKLKTVWAILRGRDHYLDALMLTPADVKKVADFLAEPTA
jgi:hypothetical protein